VIMVTGENVGQIAVEAIRRGATDYVVKFGDYLFTIPLVVEKNLTVALLKREKEQLQKQLEEKNELLEAEKRRVEEVAATDPLTGLYNRRHFGKVLEQLWSEASRYNHDLACVMVDLDGFKQINDAYQNHQLGDQVLITAAFGPAVRLYTARNTLLPSLNAATTSSRPSPLRSALTDFHSGSE